MSTYQQFMEEALQKGHSREEAAELVVKKISEDIRFEPPTSETRKEARKTLEHFLAMYRTRSGGANAETQDNVIYALHLQAGD